MDIEELTALDARWDKGTNLHHGLLLANRHFRKHPNAQPVLLIVTDGEPTSHLEPGGEVYFEYPPHPLTVAYAVRELDNAGRLGAQTTFFRLGDDPGLARFIDSMARRVDGRVVVAGARRPRRRGRRVVPRLARRRQQNPAMGTTETGSVGEGSGSAADDLWVSFFDGTEGHEPRPLLVAAPRGRRAAPTGRRGGRAGLWRRRRDGGPCSGPGGPCTPWTARPTAYAGRWPGPRTPGWPTP